MKTASTTYCVLLAIAATLFSSSESKGQQVKSFWDVIRNADAVTDVNGHHEEVGRLAASLSGSPNEIARLVDYVVFDAKSRLDAWTEYRVLAKLGKEAYPRALEILRDPSSRSRLIVLKERKNGFSLSEAPISLLCKIFDQDAPPPKEASRLLAPYLRSNSDEARKSAALIIGSVGSPDSIPDLRRALADEDEYVRSYALMGIERAIAGDRLVEQTKDALFTLVSRMWPDDTGFNTCDSIAVVLLKLDRDRAIKYLLNDELFSVRFRPLWRILEALDDESVEVPRNRLHAIIAEASTEPLEYPVDKVLEQALALLGAHRNHDDLAMFERFLEDENEYVARGAVAALSRFHRHYDRIRDPWAVVEKRGWDALTGAEKHICAIERLDAEVNNGGFAQYYFNPSGNHWQDARDGLAAIGAKRRHQLVVATAEKFGKRGPAVDHKARRIQLARLVGAEEDPFSEQDRGWNRTDEENLDRLLFKYNLANLNGRLRAASPDERESE